jgi:4-amino-4-deoxy-L-arabinose transferase-like glycosyltransferase
VTAAHGDRPARSVGLSSERAEQRSLPSVARRAGIALLLVAPAVVAATRIVRGGLPALMYDECEYARQTLETADQLFRRGLLVWPEVIALHQPYSKPPLLVDVAAAFLAVVGRSRPVYAIAATMAATTLLTSLVVFRLARELFSVRAAVVALLALGAIPAYALYSSRLYPEPLVTLLLFLLLAELFASSRRPAAWRALVLGATMGAGLLAKTTFPALAAGPLVICWLRAGRGGAAREPVGRGVLAAGTAVGLLVASLWYATNLDAALRYARKAYAFATWAPDSASAIATTWLRAVVQEALGVGGCALVLVALACVAVAVRAVRRGAGAVVSASASEAGSVEPLGVLGGLGSAQRDVLLALLSAALPSILLALPSPNVSTRLLLPAFAAVAVGAAPLVASARPAGALRVARALALALVAAQWTLVQLGGLSTSPAWGESAPLRAVSRWLDPYHGPLERIPTRPLEQLLHATVDLAPSAKVSRGAFAPVLYFVGNYPELDLSRFALYQVARESRVPTRWLCYFDWPAERRAEVLAKAKRQQSIVVAYRPKHPVRTDLEFLNRHGDECLRAVRDPANGFQLVRELAPAGASYALELYANVELPTTGLDRK